MFSRFKTFGQAAFISLACAFPSAAQDDKTPPAPQQQQTPQPEKPKKEEKSRQQQQTPQPADLSKLATAEQVAETAILIYSGLGGRPNLQQIRRTTVENGKITITNSDRSTEQVSYTRRVLRGESLDKERIRLDQEISGSRYSLIYTDGNVFGLFNETVFTPKDDAVKSFQNHLWRGLEALLRYKENGSTLALGGREKYMNVEYYTLDVTDRQNRTTRYYISTKTLRVMWLEYTEDEVKYTRRFYDYRYAQGTLVPYRTTLAAGDRQIEESIISTVTYGQKVEDDIFQIG